MTSCPAGRQPRVTAARTAAVAAAVLALLALAPAASAHVSVDPPTAAAGGLVQLTFTVPSEQQDQDTVGLDVTLPQGFLLESAQQVPGWTTVVDKAADRTPTAVHWSAGQAGPGTFVTFSIRGRMPRGGSTAAFPAVQRYTRTTVSWSKSDQASDLPAPVVTLQAAVKGLDGGTLPTVPAATVPAATPGAAAGAGGGSDALARSRSSLALALALGSLLLALGALGATVLLRREPPTPQSTPHPTPATPATPQPTPKTTPARTRPSGAP